MVGLSPKREMDFALADGTTIRRPVSECHISLPQGEAHTAVWAYPGNPHQDDLVATGTGTFRVPVQPAA